MVSISSLSCNFSLETSLGIGQALFDSFAGQPDKLSDTSRSFCRELTFASFFSVKIWVIFSENLARY